MGINKAALVVISALSLASTAALAADPVTVNGGTVHFKGEVVNAACAVDAGSVDQTVQNVIHNEIEVFQNLYPVKIEPIYTSEQEAIELLKKDSVRLAITARKLSQAELSYFHEKTFQPEMIRIAIDGVAIITHPSNKDSVISVKDMKRILTGEVKQWNQIYPNSKLGKIQVVFDNTNSSIVRYANDSICRDKPLSRDLSALELNEQVV